MRKVSFSFKTEESETVYLIDVEDDSYQTLSRQIKDGEVVEEQIKESGNLGDASNRQEIAKRIYYILLAGMKSKSDD